jgi:hypothetical protein
MELAKIKQILVESIPEELADNILDYYVSIFFYENVIIPIHFKLPNSWVHKNPFLSTKPEQTVQIEITPVSTFGTNPYYLDIKEFWRIILTSEMRGQDKITSIIRHWIYNPELVQQNLSTYVRFRSSIERNLIMNIRDSPIWGENLGKYLYKQVFFKEFN